MNIFILTIHNPNISYGPNIRLEGFLKSPEMLGENIYRLPFRNDKKFIKLNTIKILFKSLFHIIKNRKKIDLIHVVTPPSYTAPIAKFAKRFFKIPYIVDIGDPYAENMAELKGFSYQSLRYRFLKWLDNSLYKKADQLVLSSDGLSKYLPENIKQTTILTGLVHQNDIEKTKNHTNSFNKKCLFLGQYGALQKFEYIFEVFSEAIKHDKEIMLDVIGVGDKKKFEGSNPNIKFYDPIPQNKIFDKIKHYSCGIVSLKLNQGLDYAIPTKLLTYLSYGLPIFGTGGESSKKLIDKAKTGYISSEYNIQKDVLELFKLMGDKNRILEFSKNALVFAEKNLTFEIAGACMHKIYKALI
ncbi:hypothetical protein JW911_03595 [Candidatus Peregrinibacteria bacterium]|nr:hypothetical protein [Candidatus Peregrinibacteria bacterium]